MTEFTIWHHGTRRDRVAGIAVRGLDAKA